MLLQQKIIEAILEERVDLDNIPSVVIAAVVSRTLDELQDLLPSDCKPEEIFEDWTLCECGQLVPTARAVILEKEPLCIACVCRIRNDQKRYP